LTASKFIRDPLGTILVAALLAAIASFFVFVESGEAAPATDDQPSADKASYQIVGGKPVPNGTYPFMAALLDTDAEGSIVDQHFCGGTLIDKDTVLTAGHCFFKATETGGEFTKTPENTDVTVGRTVLKSDQGKVRDVEDIDVHPKYKGQGDPDQRYDVAVLELSRPVKGINPIKLATSDQNNLEKPGRDAIIAGWGSTVQVDECGEGTNSQSVNRLQEARVPIISDKKTEEIYQKEVPECFDLGPFVPKLMIAAGGTDVDSCQGDSGGPLFVRSSANDDNGRNGNDENDEDENGGTYTQIGIVSFGPGCAAGYPSAYTEVNAKPIASFIERSADSN
jgi:secreted trypsin-like serine protease